MVFEQLPDPVPGVGEVVVMNHAIGVNPVETYIRAGNYGGRAFPFTPGTDAAGVVWAMGEGVASMHLNQRVYAAGSISGAYAEKMLCKAAQVHPLPDRLTFEQGAAIGVPYATAWRALFVRGQAQPGEWVLIHGGSGGVGTAAIQLAVKHGCRVIATAGTDAGLELIRQLGASVSFDHRNDNYIRQIRDLTAGSGQINSGQISSGQINSGGVDLILEMRADLNLDKDLGLLGRRGRVVVVGNRGRTEIDARQTMARDSDIRGMSLMNADEAELKMIHTALGAEFRNGSLTPVIGNRFPLVDAARAHEAILQPGAMGKILLMT
jgi:NADPH2:quinone reductase